MIKITANNEAEAVETARLLTKAVSCVRLDPTIPTIEAMTMTEALCKLRDSIIVDIEEGVEVGGEK
jgi:hypothetical protein